MKTRLTKLLLILLPSTLMLLESRADDQPSQQRREISTFMRKKVKLAQGVLEALANEDFDVLTSYADGLKRLGMDSQWKVTPNLTYIKYSAEFTSLAEELGRRAKEKDLNGTTLAYVRMTINCVECHKFCRDQRILDPKLHRGGR